MPDKKITQLVDGSPVQPTDEFVVARAGDNFKIDAADVVAAVTKHDVTLAGNTAGALALISSGTMTLAGGNNITLSQAGNAVTISGAAAGGAQTFIGGISASDTLYTSGSVRISGSQAATVRSGTGQLVIIDVPVQSTQVETQTFIAGISASDTLYTSGNVRLTGVGGGVTVSSNTGQRVDISVAAQSVQPETQTFIAGVSASDTLYTSGNVRITGVGGGITVSSNTGQRIDLSVAAPVAQTNQAGSVYAISNTSGTSSGTYDARTLSIAGAGMITVAASNSGWRINATQSVQPETQTFISGISASDTLYTSGQVRITGVGGGITVSSNTGQRVDLSVAAQSVQTQGVMNVGVSTGGNTSGNTGVATGTRLVLAGGNNITLSQGTAANATTITISAGAAGAGGTLADWENYPQNHGNLLTHISGISKVPIYWHDTIGGGITANTLAFRLSMVTANAPASFTAHLGIYTFVNSTSMALLGSLSEEYVISSASSNSFSGHRAYVMSGIGTHTALSTLSQGEYAFGLMFSATATAAMNASLYGAAFSGGAAGPLGRVMPGTNELSAAVSQGVMPLWGRGSTTVDSLPVGVVGSELINQGAGGSLQIHPWIYIRS